MKINANALSLFTAAALGFHPTAARLGKSTPSSRQLVESAIELQPSGGTQTTNGDVQGYTWYDTQLSKGDESCVSFEVKVSKDAHIGLFPDKSFGNGNYYEIVIGGWIDTKTCIRDASQAPCLVQQTENQGWLDPNQYSSFWVCQASHMVNGVKNTNISVGKGSVAHVDKIASVDSTKNYNSRYVGINSLGTVGNWRNVKEIPYWTSGGQLTGLTPVTSKGAIQACLRTKDGDIKIFPDGSECPAGSRKIQLSEATTVDTLKALVSTLQSEISTLNTNVKPIATLQSDVAALQSKAIITESLKSEVETLKTSVTNIPTLQTDVAALQTNIPTLQSDVAALQSKVTTTESLKSEVDKLKTELALLSQASNLNSNPNPISGPKKVFLTSSKYDGNLGGLTGADDKCQQLASAAGLNGTYKAWLSTSTSDVSQRFQRSTSGSQYVLTDGSQLASDWSDLTDGTIQNKIMFDESSSPIVEGQGQYFSLDKTWTNTNYDATVANIWDCNGWTSNSSYDFGLVGSSQDLISWSFFGGTHACSSQLRLFCFEQ